MEPLHGNYGAKARDQPQSGINFATTGRKVACGELFSPLTGEKQGEGENLQNPRGEQSFSRSIFRYPASWGAYPIESRQNYKGLVPISSLNISKYPSGSITKKPFIPINSSSFLNQYSSGFTLIG